MNGEASPDEGTKLDTGILLPDGTTAEARDEPQVTERKLERSAEDRHYVPVIIKRTDETRRHPDDTLENAIQEGLEQLHRSPSSLLLSAVAAGLIVGFSPMAVAVVTSAAIESHLPDLVTRIATSVVYPLGFVICVMSGAQLFTEHTATALYPVLDRRASVGRLLRLWALVVLGNLAGAAIGAVLHYLAADVVGGREGYLAMGRHLIVFSGPSLFVSAILAGWLMALRLAGRIESAHDFTDDLYLFGYVSHWGRRLAPFDCRFGGDVFSGLSLCRVQDG